VNEDVAIDYVPIAAALRNERVCHLPLHRCLTRREDCIAADEQGVQRVGTLRMSGAKVPSVYGPSRDEPWL
jgi:hypothetical protein